jgi:hypothetical protein
VTRLLRCIKILKQQELPDPEAKVIDGIAMLVSIFFAQENYGPSPEGLAVPEPG